MERETLEVDVLLVGAGPASLAAALHLSVLANDHEQLRDLTLLVIEKGKEIGSHALSGAVIDPRGFEELLSGWTREQPPYDSPVQEDAVVFLSKRSAFRLPVTPPPLRNRGCYVGSLGKLVRWMAHLCEQRRIEVYPEFPAVELLYEGRQVVGARIGDRGRDRQGKPKENFQPGINVRAKLTVLGEGPRGTLVRQAERRLQLDRDRQPQIYSVGVKEIWRVPGEIPPGRVFHTLGYPLGAKELGGGFLYTMKENLVDIGYVVGLDSEDPSRDSHRLFQEFKAHPWLSNLLQGGTPLCYGAKTIPEGGYYAMPQMYADGLLIVGDAAGWLNSQRLKGIHLAVKSGMLAAETMYEALLQEDYSSQILQKYSGRFARSWAGQELWKVRNFRQGFQRGFWSGMFHTGIQYLTGGRGFKDPLPLVAGHRRMKTHSHFSHTGDDGFSFDNQLTFDKLTDVYFSDTAHEEDQPCHLKILDLDICHQRCTQEYGNPCQHFCPAQVYEMSPTEVGPRLQLNYTNCVHCKTCDIADPYQIIVWTPPEGGGGSRLQEHVSKRGPIIGMDSRTAATDVSFQGILQARKQVYRHLRPTSLIHYPLLSEFLTCEAFVKHENHNPTGAFKVRGGINLISQLSPAEKTQGVITATRGNHGQSIALACRIFGVPCTVAIPHGNNPDKNQAMQAYGAELLIHGHDFDEARLKVEEIQKQRELRYVHSANEPLLIHGVGTYALEILQDLPDLDYVFAPLGGGSGVVGILTVTRAVAPTVRVIGVQSERAAAVYLSWKKGEMISTPSAETMADGLATRIPFELTFPIIQRDVYKIVTVSDEEIMGGMYQLFRTTHNVAEGAGAAAAAAAFKLRREIRGKKVVLILSGGNIDAETFQSVLQNHGPPPSGG